MSQARSDDKDDDYDESYSISDDGGTLFSDRTQYLGGEGSIDGASLDTIGRMLIQLEDNSASLTELTLDCNTLDKVASNDIELSLPDNTRVTKLHLLCGTRSSHKRILYRIISGLMMNASVTHLIIQDANIDDEISSWLSRKLSHSRTLKHICLQNCEGSGLEKMFVAMQQNKLLRHSLTVLSCDWEYHITDIMALSLPLMNLESLSLIDVTIPLNGWPYLFKKISECQLLKELDLSMNQMDPGLIFLLTRCLTSQRGISKLTLSSCCLDDACMKGLAKGLFYPLDSPLTSLDLSKNYDLTDEAIPYLQQVLLENTSIAHLKISGCTFEQESLEVLDCGLRYNTSIMKNFVSFNVFDTVDSFTIVNRGIKELEVSKQTALLSVSGAAQQEEQEVVVDSSNANGTALTSHTMNTNNVPPPQPHHPPPQQPPQAQHPPSTFTRVDGKGLWRSWKRNFTIAGAVAQDTRQTEDEGRDNDHDTMEMRAETDNDGHTKLIYAHHKPPIGEVEVNNNNDDQTIKTEARTVFTKGHLSARSRKNRSNRRSMLARRRKMSRSQTVNALLMTA